MYFSPITHCLIAEYCLSYCYIAPAPSHFIPSQPSSDTPHGCVVWYRNWSSYCDPLRSGKKRGLPRRVSVRPSCISCSIIVVPISICTTNPSATTTVAAHACAHASESKLRILPKKTAVKLHTSTKGCRRPNEDEAISPHTILTRRSGYDGLVYRHTFSMHGPPRSLAAIVVLFQPHPPRQHEATVCIVFFLHAERFPEVVSWLVWGWCARYDQFGNNRQAT